jgi:hypothetical protein
MATSVASRPRRMRPMRGVSGIKGVPALSEEHLKPRPEIPSAQGPEQFYQVAGAVSRRNIHATTQHDRKMREICRPCSTTTVNSTPAHTVGEI